MRPFFINVLVIGSIITLTIFIILQNDLGPQHFTVGGVMSLMKPQKPENPLDGCLHVYLDMGSNRGIQIRKLYEGSRYPDAAILPVFDKYFGLKEERNHSEICSVGFEGAKEYAKTLSRLAKAYRRCGWPVRIFTSTGVGVRDSEGSFIYNGLGGHFAEGTELSNEEVPNARMISIARFIKEVVATRQLPESSRYHTPHVLMKLDVEGLEKDIIPDLLMSGAAKFVDYLYVDFHIFDFQGPHFEIIAQLKAGIDTIMKLANAAGLEHVIQITDLDDETYADAHLPLPDCGKDPKKSTSMPTKN